MYGVEVRHVSNGSPLFSLKPFAGSKMFPRQKVMLKLQKGRGGFWQYLSPSQSGFLTKV